MDQPHTDNQLADIRPLSRPLSLPRPRCAPLCNPAGQCKEVATLVRSAEVEAQAWRRIFSAVTVTISGTHATMKRSASPTGGSPCFCAWGCAAQATAAQCSRDPRRRFMKLRMLRTAHGRIHQRICTRNLCIILLIIR